MNIAAFAVIGLGAALGAWARWVLGLWLNPLFAQVPMGTLAANLIGGYLIGVAVAVFHIHVDLAPEIRLFCITGFLGGLTTFSSFSAEVVSMLMQQRYTLALMTATIHLLGSLLLTVAGMKSASLFLLPA